MLKSILVTVFAGLCCCSCYAQSLNGSWRLQNGDTVQVAMFIDGYFSHSVFDKNNKKFIATRGGAYKADKDKIVVVWQYDTEKAAAAIAADTWVGTKGLFKIKQSGNTLHTNISGASAEWIRLDKNDAPLAGVWRITHRKQEAQLSEIPLRDRRTLKILTGTRFQWVAINIKTGEFSGTGGGTYTFKNGRYTENIEFFSRNNARVGASLTFDGRMENGQWHHAGKSSSGDPIYEIWGKLEE